MTARAKAQAKGRWKFWRRHRPDGSEIPSVWRLFGGTYRFFIDNWKVMGVFLLAYAACYFLLVRAVPEINLDEYRQLIDLQLGAEAGAVKTFALAGLALVGASGSASAVQVVYGLILLVVFSLAAIWAIRHITAGKKFNFRDVFYRSQTPLIPYLSLVMLMTIQLIPLALGSFIFAIVNSRGIAVGPWENLLFWLIWIVCGLLSAYWLVNSVMASYAVTLPGMYPWAAIKATGRLVKGRRWYLLKKMLFLPIVLLLIFGLIFLFLVAVAPAAAFWFYDLSFVLALPIIHVYYYQLYRTLT